MLVNAVLQAPPHAWVSLAWAACPYQYQLFCLCYPARLPNAAAMGPPLVSVQALIPPWAKL